MIAAHRTSVPEATKRALREQAGGKCANPGCAASRTHLHHVREWAIYQSHDGRHMIAVCPTCHDAIHNGELRITDETLYRWKSILRSVDVQRGHVYVEPASQAKLLLGSIAVTGDAGLVVFELSTGNTLSFAVRDNDIVLLSLVLTDRRRTEVVRLVDGHVKTESASGVEYAQVPGRHAITAPLDGRYMPNWALRRIQWNDPAYRPTERVTLLELEVIEPGVVRVEGIWLEQDHGVVITPQALHLVSADPSMTGSVALQGDGVDSVLHFTGPITTALFGFGGPA